MTPAKRNKVNAESGAAAAGSDFGGHRLAKVRELAVKDRR
jgi:hypothetical protein